MITVIGSLNIDFVVSVDRRPNIGETIMSNSLDILYGGKGGNQAVAAAKLGKKVSFVGAIGNDLYGDNYIEELKKYDINTDCIFVKTDETTGIAMVAIEKKDNSIIYTQGANGQLNIRDIEVAKDIIKKSAVILVQLEVNNDVVEKVIELASRYHIPVILNPAPYKHFPIEWLEKISYITPNKQEYESIVSNDNFNDKYINKFIITLGKQGVVYYKNNIQHKIAAPKVEVVDTTGAGDTFNGVFAYYLSINTPLKIACEKATYAASYSTTKIGAQFGMPSEKELKKFIKHFSD